LVQQHLTIVHPIVATTESQTMPKRTSIRERITERYKRREAKLEKLRMLESILAMQESKRVPDMDYVHDLHRRIHRLQTQLKVLSTVPLHDDS
jgi:hypothetical protein